MKFIKAPETEDEQLETIKKSAFLIKYIINPSEQIQLETVKQNPFAIQYIINPSELIQLEAIKQNIGAIQFIKTPSIKTQQSYLNKCLEYNITHIYQIYIKDLNHKQQQITIIKSPETEEEQLKALQQNLYSIRFIHNPSEHIQLQTVKQYGWVIRYIYNPSEQVKLEAFNQNIYTIEYIHNPSINIQNLYLSHCLKHNKDIHQIYVKDLDQNKIKNLIDCKNLIN